MEKEKVVVVVVKVVVQAMVGNYAGMPPKPAKRSSWQEMRCQRSCECNQSADSPNG